MGNLYMGYNLNTQRYFFYSNLNLLKLWDVVAAVVGPQPKSEFGDFGLKLWQIGTWNQDLGLYVYPENHLSCRIRFDDANESENDDTVKG